MACLGEEEVVAYLEHSASVEERRRVEAHVDSCPDCRGLIADLVHYSVVQPGSAPSGVQLAGADLLPPGSMVDHFRVVRLLGRGGMGEVYLARDTKLGRKVALKLIRPEWAPSPHALQRFLMEARTTAKFSHPHIITIFTVGEHQGLPYLALEYLAGRTLRQRMDEEPIQLREAMRLALAIAQALEESHRHGVLHGDLKPANVLIPRDGRLRVVDFGLARTLTRNEERGAAELSTQILFETETSLGHRAVQGTPLYMAPEQWRGESCREATDIWALGMIVCEMTGGRLPYADVAADSLRARVLDSEPVPRVAPKEGLPEELDRLISACLEKDATRRPSAGAIIRVLGGLVAHGVVPRDGEENCPFRGLLPFAEGDAALFFGRDAEIAAFLERLRDSCVLPVVGPSGAGKSSFVQAGVLPRLREQGWRVLGLRPGGRPFHALAGRLLAASSAGLSSSSSAKSGGEHSALREQLAAELQAQPARLGWLLQQRVEQEGGRLVLFVDQLEEVYTLIDDDRLRLAFMEALCLASDDPREGVRIVFTLRDDYLGRLVRGPEVQEALRQITVIHSPDAAVLKETLLRPLEAVGYKFDDVSLADEMVQAVKGEPACLALLQFAVQLLWERRDIGKRKLTRESYQAMGGVGGALASHADGLLGSLSATEVSVARELLLRLVTPEGTRRLLAPRQLLEGLGPAADDVVDRLTRGRLLSVRKGEGEVDAEVELVHESLIPAWGRLRHWLDESREERSFLAEVGQAAELWDRRGRRTEELWSGDALGQAQRKAQHCAQRLPSLVDQFLDQAATEQRRRLRRRRVRAVAGIVLLSLLAVASSAIAIVLARQKRAVTAQKERALAQRAEALRESARAALLRGELLEARAKLRLALEAGDSLLARALWWQVGREPQICKRDLAANVYDVAFAPDGKTLAAASQGGVAYLLDVQTLASRTLPAHGDQVLSVAYAPDGRRVAGGCIDGSIRLWDLSGGTVRVLRGHTAAVWRLRFAPDGSRLASASWDKTVRLWDVRSLDSQPRVLQSQAQVYAVAFSPDGKRLASAGSDRKVQLWSPTGEPQQALSGHAERIYSVAFSPDGSQLASGSADRTIRIWPLAAHETETRSRVLSGHSGGVYGVTFSPDGRQLFSASWDGTLRSWSLGGTSKPRIIGEHEAGLYAVAVARTPQGELLATGGADKMVRLWQDREQARREPRVGHSWEAWSVAFSPDGKRLASSGRDRTIRVWEMASGVEQKVLRGHEALVTGLAFSPDGKRLASGGADKTIRLWAPETGIELHALVGHTASVRGIAFGPDGTLLASTSADRTVRLWDTSRAALLRTLEGHSGPTMEVAFSPDGKLLVSSSMDGTLRIWDARTGAMRRVLQGHQAGVFGVAFSPDGKRLASSSDDHTLRLWELEGDKAARVVGRHEARLHFLDFHPDGRRVLTAGADGSLRLWDLETGRSKTWPAHRAEVNYVRFAPDGRLAASCSDDGTVRTWRIDAAAPFWRAPLLLGGSTELFSHRGVETLGPGVSRVAPANVPSTVRWRKQALDARLASASANGKLLCVQTQDGRVALWDMSSDKLLVSEQEPAIHGVLATRAGCLVQRTEELRFYDRGGAFKQVAGRCSALAPDREGALVAEGERVLLVDELGSIKRRLPGSAGVTALSRAGGWLVLGFASGSLELIPLRDGAPVRPGFSFEHTPASPALIIREGLPGTVVVGYANGMLGMWSLEDGLLLVREELHGAVVHVLSEKGWLFAASDLADHRAIDLTPLRLEHCALMRSIWSSVPVVWDSGFPVSRPPPSDHPCLSTAH